ncbi:glutathione S-transferase [Roseobacter sp.]|uniref:glutathione S-transferase n=1 Tax=Roseobacter sp. TaxID=1907202 RepID=UPI0032979A99
MAHLPILWTFRRCPYAIRARLAVACAGLTVEVREILLRDKPPAFLQTSTSGTVPALRLDHHVIDESLDIMIWALEQNDPLHLLRMPDAGWRLIEANDGPFKTALDHTKYNARYPHLDRTAERSAAADHLLRLEVRLAGHLWLFGDHPTLADYAVLPFVRQFAFVDRVWFDAQPWPGVIAWLDRFLGSDPFAQVMHKYVPWADGDAPVLFNA